MSTPLHISLTPIPVRFLQVVVPRSPLQAKGLLLASIRDPNPVLFLEPKALYRSSVEEVPTGDFELPLGQAEVLRQGSDVTIISYGPPLYTIERALNLLKDPGGGADSELARLVPSELRGLSVEVIDLRTIVPYDIETVVRSVNKTGRCVIVHEAPLAGGMGSELAAEIQQRCFLRLEAPVQRVTGWDTPFGLAYEKFYVPDAIRVVSHSLSVDCLVRPNAVSSVPVRAARLAYPGDGILDHATFPLPPSQKCCAT